MKKILFYFTVLTLCLSAFTGCKDDDTEGPVNPPPTLGDIVAKYESMTLKATVNELPASGNAAVAVVKEQDNTMTLQLINIVPGAPVFNIPNSTFEAVTGSANTSNVAGAKTDSLAGYDVKFTGSVTDSVMTATITLTEMQGVLTNVKAFYNKTYKGDMKIGVPGTADPVASMQRVYTSSPKGADTSSIRLQINNFSFSGMNLGDISLDTIKVLKRGQIYGFKAEGRKLTLPMGEISLNVYGTMVGDNMNLTMSVTAGSILADVSFTGGQVTESTDLKIGLTIPGEAVVEQPVIDRDNYRFKAWGDESLVLTPKVTLPQGAVLDSVMIYNDETKIRTLIDTLTAIDFSTFSEKSCVEYYVTAEDVRKKGNKLLFIEKVGTNLLYTLEEWVVDNSNKEPTPKGLTNSNILGTLLPLYDIRMEHFPVEKAADGAAEIRTSRTVSPIQPQELVPGVTIGMLFNGLYNMDISNMLKSTHFGELISKEPTQLKFSFKYDPGDVFHKDIVGDSVTKEGIAVKYHGTEPVPGMKDSCSICAYLYEVSNSNESLDGTNINTSTKVIKKAIYYDGVSRTNYEDINIPFVNTGNGTYDSKKLYKLAIICSSSKRADEFMGAPGSILTIKRLEVKTK